MRLGDHGEERRGALISQRCGAFLSMRAEYVVATVLLFQASSLKSLKGCMHDISNEQGLIK